MIIYMEKRKELQKENIQTNSHIRRKNILCCIGQGTTHNQ